MAKRVDIKVRATPAEKKALSEAAKKSGRPLGNWLVRAGLAASVGKVLAP